MPTPTAKPVISPVQSVLGYLQWQAFEFLPSGVGRLRVVPERNPLSLIAESLDSTRGQRENCQAVLKIEVAIVR